MPTRCIIGKFQIMHIAQTSPISCMRRIAWYRVVKNWERHRTSLIVDTIWGQTLNSKALKGQSRVGPCGHLLQYQYRQAQPALHTILIELACYKSGAFSVPATYTCFSDLVLSLFSVVRELKSPSRRRLITWLWKLDPYQCCDHIELKNHLSCAYNSHPLVCDVEHIYWAWMDAGWPWTRTQTTEEVAYEVPSKFRQRGECNLNWPIFTIERQLQALSQALIEYLGLARVRNRDKDKAK